MTAPTPTPDQYAVGAVKQAPDSTAVAVRTVPHMPGEWAVMTVNRGGHHADWDEVKDWPDMAAVHAAVGSAQ